MSKLGRSLPVPQVFSDYAERVIEFEKIISWNEKEENKAVYRVTKDILHTKEDWIGLFKVNFRQFIYVQNNSNFIPKLRGLLEPQHFLVFLYKLQV